MKTIQLTKGYSAQVDDEDFELLIQFRWAVSCLPCGIKYAQAKTDIMRRGPTSMHRFIMCAKPGELIDHIDRNGLNNQKSNLRFASGSENMINRRLNTNNTSGFKGVCWEERIGKWRAATYKLRKTVFLGNFNDKVSAARAYDRAIFSRTGSMIGTNEWFGLL